MAAKHRIVLIVSGGIAAYKSLELIRRMKEQDIAVRCVLTRGGAQFVTPLSLAALSEDKVYQDLFSLTDEQEMGHIQLSRQADLIVVSPASADILAKMTAGLADDLATTVLLATDKPVLVAPAMNVRMWDHPATQANLATLKARGVSVIGPDEGPMACGEFGFGRLSEPADIVTAIQAALSDQKDLPLKGRKVLVTAGPTHEPIDPVRYIANRSSGKQGHAIAAALAAQGASVTLVDVAIFAAAVADWRIASESDLKLKKQDGADCPTLTLMENPDILKTIAHSPSDRPALVIGFAAETGSVVEKAIAKRARKGCDWILANDVSLGTGTFGGDDNTIHFITQSGTEDWPAQSKQAVAQALTDRIADFFRSDAGPKDNK